MKSCVDVTFVIGLFVQSSLALQARQETAEDIHLKRLLVKDVGQLHNDIMEEVNYRMIERKPKDYNEYVSLVAEQMQFVCRENDDKCTSSLIDTIVSSAERRQQREEAGDDFSIHSVLPDVLGSKTKGYFEAVHSILLDVRNQYRAGKGHRVDVDQISKKISNVTAMVEKSDAHYGVKLAIKSVASVASNSLEYWTDAVYDRQNSFRRLHEEHRRSLSSRSLQLFWVADVVYDIVGDFFGFFSDIFSFTLAFNPADVAIADFIGAVVGSVDPLINILFGGENSTIALILNVFTTSSTDSLDTAGVVYYASPEEVVRCLLEGLLQNSGCTLTELFFNGTGLD